MLFNFKLIFLLFFLFTLTSTKAENVNTIDTAIKDLSSIELVLNSHSFNTHERSTFTYDSQTESIERGLTIVHLQADNKIEFKTFDTYGSKEDVKELLEVLTQMKASKAIFAILAHDSAAAQLTGFEKQLSDLGFLQLSALKGRQAYIMHNINGVIVEQVNDNSVTETLSITSSIGSTAIYFPKEVYEFE